MGRFKLWQPASVWWVCSWSTDFGCGHPNFHHSLVSLANNLQSIQAIDIKEGQGSTLPFILYDAVLNTWVLIIIWKLLLFYSIIAYYFYVRASSLKEVQKDLIIQLDIVSIDKLNEKTLLLDKILLHPFRRQWDYLWVLVQLSDMTIDYYFDCCWLSFTMPLDTTSVVISCMPL